MFIGLSCACKKAITSAEVSPQSETGLESGEGMGFGAREEPASSSDLESKTTEVGAEDSGSTLGMGPVPTHLMPQVYEACPVSGSKP